MLFFVLAPISPQCYEWAMEDFQIAFRTWIKKKRLLVKEVGAMLEPPVTTGTISNWLNGVAEPKRGHRGQLVKLSKNIIKAKHFL